MNLPLSIQHAFSLRNHNTFRIDARADAYLAVTSIEMLQAVAADRSLSGMPRLILGGGSNILLTQDFSGLVLHLCLKGIEMVDADADTTYVRAAAGENWHEFVRWTLAQGLGGLENLSLIPGSVGASPIQNIGAYGVELKDCFHALTAFDLVEGRTSVLDKNACEFGYRDSVFKRRLRNAAVITDVTFALPKRWRPNVVYAELARELAGRGIAAPTPDDISAAVIAIRTRKLPDPAVIGNVGSFFKNPIVSSRRRDELLERFPDMVSYAQADGSYKLAAGWLIDRCGWKGKALGPAGVYEKQALVLVNKGGAAGRDVIRLASAIQADVQERFGVALEPEPVFV
ncbi:MAG: murB [Noviherbaspirillum sp.]|nr:murB [Noviherbaspirillum sp.]